MNTYRLPFMRLRASLAREPRWTLDSRANRRALEDQQ